MTKNKTNIKRLAKEIEEIRAKPNPNYEVYIPDSEAGGRPTKNLSELPFRNDISEGRIGSAGRAETVPENDIMLWTVF